MNSKPVNYKEAVEYIESIPKFTQKHTQEHTREFLERLGRPAFDRKVVHVAGTNGKGSVCAYIQAILEAEGKKTGFFTSPHLISINERIQIGREPIDNEKFYQVFEHVYDVVKKMEEEGIPHPSYFELMKVVNDEGEIGEEPVVNSRYSIVLATAKRARQIIAGAKPLIDDPVCNKPLSIAVEELYRGEVKIVPGEDEN